MCALIEVKQEKPYCSSPEVEVVLLTMDAMLETLDGEKKHHLLYQLSNEGSESIFENR